MSATWVLTDHLRVEEARTPSLIGLPIAEAGRVVDRAGLQLRSYPVEARGLAADVVVEQAPPAGAVVRAGRIVNVGVHVPAEADRMPSLVGLSETDATATLRDLSLPAPDVRYVASNDPSGAVIRQEPEAGRSVPSGTNVELVVSRGQAAGYVELPDLRGLAIDEAVAQATVLGLRRVETLPTAVRADEPGRVTVQRPGPGAIVRPGEPLMLGYAIEGASVTQVPDVVGLEVWDARVALLRAGLDLGPTETVRRADLPEGVIEVRPDGLTVAGSPIVLVVNVGPGGEDVSDATSEPSDAFGPDRFGFVDDFGRDGAVDAGDETENAGRDGAGVRDGADAGVPDVVGGDPQSGRLIPFTFDPATLGVRSLLERDYDLRLVVRDDGGERAVLDRRVPAGQAVRTTVVVRGDEPLLQTYVNDVFFQAWRP